MTAEKIRTAVGRESIRSVSKLVLGTGALILLVALASLLPGVDWLVPETPLTVGAVITALATLAVVGLLTYLASGLAALTRLALSGPETVVENVASVVHWLVVLAAVLVGHAGLAGAVRPLVGAAWLYDLAFLLAALAPLTVIASRLFVTLDPAAELFADRIAGPNRDDGPADATPESDDSTA